MDLLYMAICEILRARGLVSKAAAMVIYAMVTEGLSFEAARDAYAAFVDDAPERVQSVLCYDVLRAGFDMMPAELFREIVGEVGKVEN